MADDADAADADAEEEEDEAPAVELGPDETVEGAPAARVASRLTWPLEKSEVDRKEGDAVIRTPDGPRPLSEILEEVDATYFDRRQTFLAAIRDAVGAGPIPTGE